MRILGVFLVAAVIAACSEESRGGKLPSEKLMTLSGLAAEPLSTCPTKQCLTVLVAPWCGICRAESGNINLLRRWLDDHGVSSRVVVGLSNDLKAIKEFAAVFGPDTLLDPTGVMTSRGVPTFVTSDHEGLIVKRLEGFPNGVQSPAELAEVVGIEEKTP